MKYVGREDEEDECGAVSPPGKEKGKACVLDGTMKVRLCAQLSPRSREAEEEGKGQRGQEGQLCTSRNGSQLTSMLS